MNNTVQSNCSVMAMRKTVVEDYSLIVLNLSKLGASAEKSKIKLAILTLFSNYYIALNSVFMISKTLFIIIR